MIYILEDGRVLPDKSLIGNEKYIELAEYPEPVYQDGMVGVIIGIENNAIKYEFVEESAMEELTSEPTEIEMLMQAFADAELRDMESQKERQFLAQQVSDLEIAILEGGVSNV